jgi:hypothetical protein
MAEMALVPSIYRRYSTRIKPGFEGVAPGITSRFEVFTDDSFAQMKVGMLSISLAAYTDHVKGTHVLDRVCRTCKLLNLVDLGKSTAASLLLYSHDHHDSAAHQTPDYLDFLGSDAARNVESSIDQVLACTHDTTQKLELYA